MSSPLAAVEDFLSPDAKYELYNFHRPDDRSRMLQALRGPAPRIVALEGVDEENHLLLLEAACRQESLGGEHWECVRLSFQDYDPDSSTAESFLNDQLARHAAQGGKVDKLREALSGLALGLNADLDISTAFAMSVAVSGGMRFAELLQTAAPTFKPVRGYPGPGPERLRTLVEMLTGRSRLALYLPGSYPLPVTLRRWLINICRRTERLLLAFADVTADDVAKVALGAPVREHLRLAPLTLAELTASLDEHFGPNEFTPDFYDALLVQSRGVPWRVAEVMKRLMHSGALEGGGSRPWTLADPGASSAAVVSQFASTFLEPVDRLRESDDPRQKALAEFICLGALFSDRFPAGRICRHLGVDADDVDGLIGEALARFGPRSDHPLLMDCGTPRDVPGEWMLRFTNEIGRAVLHDVYAAGEREEAARALLTTLDDSYSLVTPAVARLFYDLSQHLGAGERHWFGEELEWWVGREAAEELKASLTDALIQGAYSPEMLLQIVYAFHQVWPAYRQNAILESIADADVEIPLDELLNYYHARSRVLLGLGRIEEAEHSAQTGLSTVRDNHPKAEGAFLAVLGWIARERSDYRMALRYAEATMDAALRWGRLDRLVGQAWTDLARAYEKLDQTEEAEHAYLKALHTSETLFGPDHLDTAGGCNQLAVFYGMSGSTEIALAYAERAMEIFKRRALETDQAGCAFMTLGALYAQRGDAEAAMVHSRESVRIMIRLYGPEHHATGSGYHSLGVTQTFLGDHAGAEESFREALRIRKAVRPPDHEELCETLYGLGKAVEASDPEATERYVEEALRIFTARAELGTRAAIRMLRYLVGLIAGRGDLDRAIRRAEAGITAIHAECESGGVSSLEKVEVLIASYREKLDPALHEAFTIHGTTRGALRHVRSIVQTPTRETPREDASDSRTLFTWLHQLFFRRRPGN